MHDVCDVSEMWAGTLVPLAQWSSHSKKEEKSNLENSNSNQLTEMMKELSVR